MTDIGPHLLGRNPSPPDERDYKLANFARLGVEETATTDPTELITLAAAEFKLTTITFKKWAATSYPDVTKTHWWKGFNYLELAKKALNPPIITSVTEWYNAEPILDQGNTGHCVGFSGAQWGNTLPFDDQYVNQDGHDLYYECKVIEGEPKQENGAYVRSLAEALLARKRITVYAFAETVDDAIAFIQQKGPVVFGTVWLNNMFDPDADGLVHATGAEAGGHAYLANGYDSDKNQFLFINSWSDQWGVNGHFKMSKSDAEKLFAEYGEIMAAVELPI